MNEMATKMTACVRKYFLRDAQNRNQNNSFCEEKNCHEYTIATKIITFVRRYFLTDERFGDQNNTFCEKKLFGQ